VIIYRGNSLLIGIAREGPGIPIQRKMRDQLQADFLENQGMSGNSILTGMSGNCRGILLFVREFWLFCPWCQ